MTPDTDPLDAPTTASVMLQRALARTAGADGRSLAPVTFQVDFGDLAGAEAVEAAARVDRSTRSLVFVSGEARGADGRVLATASAVYRIAAPR